MDHVHSSTTISADTRAVTIDATPASLWEFLAEPLNLPRWAVGFCRSIRPAAEPGQWIVSTAQGDIPLRMESDRASGTIDFFFSPVPGVETAAYSRVVPNGAGSEYIFTQFQGPGMTDEVFAAQVRALTEELQVLRALLHARLACPV